MVLHNIYRTLLEDQSSVSCTAEGQVDELPAQAIIDMNDTDIVLDLRSTNDQLNQPNLTSFGKSCSYTLMKPSWLLMRGGTVKCYICHLLYLSVT